MTPLFARVRQWAKRPAGVTPAQTSSDWRRPLAGGLLVSALVISLWVWSLGTPPVPAASPAEQPLVAASRLIPPTGMETTPSLLTAIAPMPAIASDDFRLSGIVTQPGAPVALLNERVVRVGDTVNGARVVDITQTGVILEQDNARLTLYIPH